MDLAVEFAWGFRLWRGFYFLIWFCFDITLEVRCNIFGLVVTYRQSFFYLIFEFQAGLRSGRWNARSGILLTILLWGFRQTKEYVGLARVTESVRLIDFRGLIGRMRFLVWLIQKSIGIVWKRLWLFRLWGFHSFLFFLLDGSIHKDVFIFGWWRKSANVWELTFLMFKFW